MQPQRFDHVSVTGLAHLDAPQVVTSAQIEEQLAPTMERLGIGLGLLQGLSGIEERRVWDDGTLPSQVATRVAEAALHGADEHGIDRADIGVLINTSVTRDFLEPSTASIIHGALGLPPTAMNFDLGNACLGFLNGMNVVASMIERGEVDHGIVVAGETSRPTVEATVARLAGDTTDEQVFREQFATLTLGSGAVAMVLSRDDEGTGHRYLGGLSRAATQHALLCVGNVDEMRTDTKGLLLAGLELAEQTWKEAVAAFDWDPTGFDRYLVHQVSAVHTKAVCETLGLPRERFPLLYPTFGNIGPCGVPTVLSKGVADGSITRGDRLALMGVGSGLNAMAAELVW
jgi:3-oxoacyl-[acyl-carrier-protein] synthase-3